MILCYNYLVCILIILPPTIQSPHMIFQFLLFPLCVTATYCSYRTNKSLYIISEFLKFCWVLQTFYHMPFLRLKAVHIWGSSFLRSCFHNYFKYYNCFSYFQFFMKPIGPSIRWLSVFFCPQWMVFVNIIENVILTLIISNFYIC